MYKKLLFIFLLSCAAANSHRLNSPQQTLNKTDKNFFIQNKGQWDSEVKYLARIGGMNAWITNSGVVYDYFRINKNFDETKTFKMNPKEKREYENKNTTIQGHVVKMQLANAENNINGVGNNQKQGYYNYFVGNDQNKWASNVPLYDNVELQGVYKNIDVKYYYDNGTLRYDYKVKPSADISQLKFKFEGQEGIMINEKGELVLKTRLGEVTNGKIYAYQTEGETQKEVVCKFEQRQDGTVGLKADSYDTKKELIIDPLIYSTFIGGGESYGDNGNSIAIDASGDAYITGQTPSLNFPATTGAYQTTMNGFYCNAFVTKLNSSGSVLVYSTFVGGNDGDWGESIVIDKSGNAYITGGAFSYNFPTTIGAFQTTIGGSNGNAFITKLNSTGSALIYSTYLGGSGNPSYGGDWGQSITIDANGNAYITGQTSSVNFPIAPGAFQTTFGGVQNVFVSKLNSTGNSLIYSTFIGGNSFDVGNSIAIDDSGNAYITGSTTSSNYPTTPGAFQTTPGSIFVTKLNSTGRRLVYSALLGVGIGNSITIDANGNAYITGNTSSSGFPTTTGAFQTNIKNVAGNAFVTKLNSSGSALIYSTCIGGSGFNNSSVYGDVGNSIAIDASGNAYIAGSTSSSDFPTTSGAFQTNYLGTYGSYTAFVTKLNSTGSSLIYSTYIGGSGVDITQSDFGTSIAIDAGGYTYITGRTINSDFPTTIGAYQTTLGGTQENAFVTKLDIPSTGVPSVTLQFSPLNGSLGNIQPVQLKWMSSAGASSYNLQLSTDSTFATTTVNISDLLDTTFSVSNLSNLITYYWRVNAVNSAGANAWSQVWNFKTLGNPSQAILLYPAANSVNIPVTINFKWNQSQDQLAIAKLKGNIKNTKTIANAGTSGKMKIANVSQYWFELMTDTTSTNYVVNDSTLADTTELVNDLQNLTNYWWRVSAMNEVGWGTFTNWSKFTTIIDTPVVVTLLSPNSNTTMPNEYTAILFTWESASFASTYELQIALNTNFNPVFFDTIGVADTIFNYHILGGIPAFSWRVRGSNIAGTGSWSSAMTVTKFLDLINAKNELPLTYEMYQNYPNPFNPSTMINYALAFSSNVRIEIYNVLGQKVRELLNEQKNAGYYSVNFNTTGLASGVYLYRIEAKSLDGKSEYRDTKKMMLLK